MRIKKIHTDCPAPTLCNAKAERFFGQQSRKNKKTHAVFALGDLPVDFFRKEMRKKPLFSLFYYHTTNQLITSPRRLVRTRKTLQSVTFQCVFGNELQCFWYCFAVQKVIFDCTNSYDWPCQASFLAEKDLIFTIMINRTLENSCCFFVGLQDFVRCG